VVSPILARKLMRDLWHRKWALMALIAIVAVGVSTYVSMAAVYRDLDGARERYYTTYRLADFTVDLKRAPEWTVQEVSALPNVRQVRTRISQSVMFQLPGRNRPTPGRALSMPPERRPVLNDLLVRSGVWFSGPDAKEAILEHQFAQANDLKPGDRIKVLLMDKQHELLVIGTAMSPEFVYLIPPGAGLYPDPKHYGVIFVPRRFLQRSSDLNGAYNQLVGTAFQSSRSGLEATLGLIERKLDPYGVTNTIPIQDQPSASTLRDELTNIQGTARIFPMIFLGVAALVLNVILTRLVTQQRSTIGTLRALGYAKGSMIFHYLGYGLVVGVLGGIFGVLLGSWLQNGLTDMYRDFFAMPNIIAHFYPSIVFTGTVIAIGSALIGAVKGCRLAAGLEPAEAMRPPPPEKGGRVVLERVPWLWSRLSFRWRMIFRAVLRNPLRSAVSVTASIMAAILLVASFSMYDSVFYLVHYQFSKIMHQDYLFALRDPVSSSGLYEARRLPTVTMAEPQLQVVTDLARGSWRRRVGLMGLHRDSRLYTPLNSAGNPVPMPQRGLILSQRLAHILHARVGDHVSLRPLIGRRISTVAPVVAIVDTYIGLQAYCDVTYLSRLLGERWVTNAVFVNVAPGSSERRLMSRVGSLPSVIGISERRQAVDLLTKMMSELMGTFFGMTVLFAGVIAFGSLLNTALISLSEREREVGTFRVLGYSPGQVAFIFAGESLVLNGAGLAAGLGLGIGAAHLLSYAFNTDMYRLPAVIEPSRLAISACLMIGFVMAAQLVVYRMIRNLRWLDVLEVKE
jgi:putative ABC transport system permease protein